MVSMEESTALVNSLQQKLADLDVKVGRFTKAMTEEYVRFADSTLRDVPKELSEEVTRVMAKSMPIYKNLYPELSAFGETSFSDHGAGDRATGSGAKGSLIGEREQRRNVFNPSSMHFLNNASQSSRVATHGHSLHLEGTGPASERGMGTQVTAGTAKLNPLSIAPHLPSPVTASGKNIDYGSVWSDTSDGPGRRSAFRRSSSSSKPQSPRRVRFDVEGEVVLPTTSPAFTSTFTGDKEFYFNDIGSSDEDEESEHTEGIEDPPPPKSISSSQKLRALSRQPINPAEWTVVTSGPDGSASVPLAHSTFSTTSSQESLEDMSTHSKLTSGAKPEGSGKEESLGLAKPPSQRSNEPIRDEDYVSSSEEELLIISKRSKTRARPTAETLLTPFNTTSQNTRTSPPVTDKFDNMNFMDDEHQGPVSHQDGADDEHESHSSTAESTSPVFPASLRAPQNMAQYSASPARVIPQVGTRIPNTPRKAIVGSYKGQSFDMPVVSDEVHAQAARMGELNSFVGSLRGHSSGLDRSDVVSFRASIGGGSLSRRDGAAPRSLSERLMMEELKEEQEDKLKDGDGNEDGDRDEPTGLQGRQSPRF